MINNAKTVYVKRGRQNNTFTHFRNIENCVQIVMFYKQIYGNRYVDVYNENDLEANAVKLSL